MSWKHGGRGGSRGYHHGDLREDLVRAALELIKEKGPAGFTFADAARWAGVSPAAPYRHFRDRDELMADVAKRGFLLSERLREAWGEAKPTPAEAFKRLGSAYLNFARTEPSYYAAMFESGVAIGNDPELREIADRSFQQLRAAAEVLVAKMPAKGRPPALMVALHIWSMTHGIASLFARADAARRPLPMSAEDLLEAQTLIYFKGLGLEP
ncbi:MAG: TetR/AcrR family transcriptional regulator [Rhizobiales bacterium]|nr:TetR/AcrR family transcriptional regulator [Hyphomicrobiales bacterium]